MQIHLIRHGQSEENLKGLSADNTNSPLTELGQAQAQAAAEWLNARTKIHRLYASTMLRARQTAHHLAELSGVDIEFDHRLREIGCNQGDGLPFDDHALPKYRPGLWASLQPYQPVCDAGENWMQFRARIGSFIEQILSELPESHEDLVYAVVCHGGVIEGFFDYVFERGPHSAVFVNSNNTGMTMFQYAPHPLIPSWRINYHNKTAHLSEAQIS